jgi:hypothetical protein
MTEEDARKEADAACWAELDGQLSKAVSEIKLMVLLLLLLGALNLSATLLTHL